MIRGCVDIYKYRCVIMWMCGYADLETLIYESMGVWICICLYLPECRFIVLWIFGVGMSGYMGGVKVAVWVVNMWIFGYTDM